ncbi:hypothetical protein niasHT_004720 [Heterodera trifolii]|uniref:Uncharacterized protein n=1 Tax=Heterodera trifolii TaxID=157864 RepID=A0ABD2M9G1_9BILA
MGLFRTPNCFYIVVVTIFSSLGHILRLIPIVVTFCQLKTAATVRPCCNRIGTAAVANRKEFSFRFSASDGQCWGQTTLGPKRPRGPKTGAQTTPGPKNGGPNAGAQKRGPKRSGPVSFTFLSSFTSVTSGVSAFGASPARDSIHQHSNHRDLIPAFQSLGLNSSAFQSLGLNSPTFQSLGLNPPTFQSPGLNPPTFQSLGLNSPTFQSLGNPPTFQSPGLNTSISITGTQFTNIPITGTQYQHFNHWDSILLHFNHWDSILLHSSHWDSNLRHSNRRDSTHQHFNHWDSIHQHSNHWETHQHSNHRDSIPAFQSLVLNPPTFQSPGLNPPAFQSLGLNSSALLARPLRGLVLARPLRGLASFWLFLQSPGLNPTSISITETQPTSISITGTQFFCVTRSAASRPHYCCTAARVCVHF